MIAEAIGWFLHRCSRMKDLCYGISLHARVVKVGFEADVVISNHILNMYAKCGGTKLARKLFDEMSERNLVSWSAMISGYDQAREYSLALELFSNLRIVPNEYVYASVISACSNLKEHEMGRQIHAHSLKHGYAPVSFVSNSLISFYMGCGCSGDALLVYQGMSEPNLVSNNALIAGFAENKMGEKGFEVYRSMCHQGITPDRFTFVGLLEICTNTGDQRKGIAFHCQTIKLKLDSTLFIGNVLITMYSEFRMLEQAEKVFLSIVEKDVVSWNSFISACSHCGEEEKGLSAFRKMFSGADVNIDEFTFASVLTACSGLTSIHNGKQIHAHLIRARPNQDVEVENALVNMYAKCGFIGYAWAVFNRMNQHSLVSWNTMIAGLGNHGQGSKALELFDEMKNRGPEPDSVTFLNVLTACNHAGLVEKGLNLFKSMEETYGISPNVEHFSCLIDLLGRAGRLREADEYMRKNPRFWNDPVALGSLLSACRVHGEKAIGERLAKKLLRFHPTGSASPYVMLSSLYASDEMWDDAAEVREMLKGSGLKKEHGLSMVDVAGRRRRRGNSLSTDFFFSAVSSVRRFAA
ncbi:PREDICTED: pentatricopeptide repeat-containing protein At1g15510, chloroplastic-like isoform X2 [Tarenaya hassleriana]|uniref:pentatricopeptide repeat-containing protein At1g15510, chloroplastic-like isoform X2 n=1 Tax=Tarenaya hassleriana TaxID=28532 RepID=UPI00053C8ED3|nr:PREDICTED: pentatricopeptide repeat-containing protein At1g15510, chloroplastic-like isoform X2 [Tarenaya hassleriana]